MIKNIVFDMGNVLVGWLPEQFALRAAGNERDAALLSAALFDRPEWALGDEGKIDREELLALALEALPERLHGALRELEENWPRWMPEVAGAESFVRRVRAAGLGLYLLSNASDRFPQALEDRSFFPLFDGILFSANDRLVKPDPAIYRLLCRRFDLEAPECFFIDDLARNIEGAKACGMQGIVFEGDYGRVEEALTHLGLRLPA